jgi:hypothetical protein
MKAISKKTLIVLAVLYAVTWIGGWIFHARDLASWAQERYDTQSKRNKDQTVDAFARGEKPFLVELREGGPGTRVNWCLLLAPGLVMADSYYVLGPLSARGSFKLVFFYGFGSVIVCQWGGWIT